MRHAISRLAANQRSHFPNCHYRVSDVPPGEKVVLILSVTRVDTAAIYLLYV